MRCICAAPAASWPAAAAIVTDDIGFGSDGRWAMSPAQNTPGWLERTNSSS
jgi:hypothetical protein